VHITARSSPSTESKESEPHYLF